MTAEGRFWSHVHKTDTCWNWIASKGPTGYGGAWSWHRHRVMQAHRVSWEWNVGRIPDGMHVLHACDNRACVNPSHLFLGDNAANVADKVAKNRQARHKLTVFQRLDIESALKSGGSQNGIARQYGVSPSLINRIAKRLNVNGAAA